MADIQDQLQQQMMPKVQEKLDAARAAQDKTTADKTQEMLAASKREVTMSLEKKMHAALDAALETLRAEAKGTAGSGGGAEMGTLKKEFEEMRAAIKRNAQWLLQAPV